MTAPRIGRPNLAPATRPARCARHVYRPVRDTGDRELGYLCLGCGRLVHRRGTVDLLEASALGYLLNPDVELGDVCRRRLETIRRRLARLGPDELARRVDP